MTAKPPKRCGVHLTHLPAPLEMHVHHVWPLAMKGPDSPENRVVVCPTGHANIHRILRALIDGLPLFGARSERKVAQAGYQMWLEAGKPGRPE